MDVEGKLGLLAEGARYDVCLSSCAGNARGGVGRFRDPVAAGTWRYPAAAPGRASPGVGILKVLQTSVCRNNCRYCNFAACRDTTRRATLGPDELATEFMGIRRAGLAHGIFLTSGVRVSADVSMARMVETARILRRRHSFDGYIHLKVLPGASRDVIREAARWATRLSVNLEASGPRSLEVIAPDKHFVRDLLERMKWTADAVRTGGGASSHTTQFVVGATPESDLDILRTVDWIYRELWVFRSYFSAYQPLSPEERGSAGLLDREHRLYQADYLLRGYGFRFADLVFDAQGNLPTQVDPKTAWALIHPERYPVDVSRATEEDLLRVPGIGPRTAQRVVRTRETTTIRDFRDLARLGRVPRRAECYLRFPGRGSDEQARGWRQLELWSADALGRGWSGGRLPLAPEKVTGTSYSYPGQTGRRLHYDRGTADSVVRCR